MPATWGRTRSSSWARWAPAGTRPWPTCSCPPPKPLPAVHIRLLDGSQEVFLLRCGESAEVTGSPGDTVSLIPLGGDAQGVTTSGLEYPLTGETLAFGATRGVSNVLLGESATVHLESGLLLCVVIHGRRR